MTRLSHSKKCFKCGINKRIGMFYSHSEMGDGHLNKCKMCTKKDSKKRYHDPRFKEKIKAYDKERNKTKTRREGRHESRRRRRIRYPGKYKANQMVGNAIRDGRLKRMPCIVCGDVNSQAHHPDYRKPLFIKWLCFRHHRMEHGQLIQPT
jgi:hypothetical protein